MQSLYCIYKSLFFWGGGGDKILQVTPLYRYLSLSLCLLSHVNLSVKNFEVAQTLNYDGSVRTDLLILLMKTKQDDTILDISFIILVSLSKCYTSPKWFPISSHARNDLVKGNPGYYPTKSPAILGPHKETARKQR